MIQAPIVLLIFQVCVIFILEFKRKQNVTMAIVGLIMSYCNKKNKEAVD